MNVDPSLRPGLTLADYEAVVASVDELAESVGLAPGGVRCFGSVGWPGISDLDLLVLGKGERLGRMHCGWEEVARRDDRHRFILQHPPVYLPLELTDLAPRLHRLTGLRASTGETGPELRESGEPVPGRDLLWFTFFYVEVARLLNPARPATLRKRLLLQKNLLHSLRAFGDPATAGAMTSKVEDCRRRALAGGGPDLEEEVTRSLRDMLLACLGAVERHYPGRDKGDVGIPLPVRRDIWIRGGFDGVTTSRVPFVLVRLLRDGLRRTHRLPLWAAELEAVDEASAVCRGYGLPRVGATPFQVLPASNAGGWLRNQVLRGLTRMVGSTGRGRR